MTALGQTTSWAQSFDRHSEADRAKFHEAFKTCAEKYGKPERGQKPSDEFEACMTAAGFKRPSGPPPQDGGPGDHAADNSQSISSSQQ